MNAATETSETLSVVVEREVPYPVEKIWRALTTPHLIAEWLMKNDFQPVVGHKFDFKEDWGSVACEVMEIEPQKTLSYTWGGYGLGSLVTWTLSPTARGTHLRMEHSGFSAGKKHAAFYQGAKQGWPKFLANLETLLAKAE